MRGRRGETGRTAHTHAHILHTHIKLYNATDPFRTITTISHIFTDSPRQHSQSTQFPHSTQIPTHPHKPNTPLHKAVMSYTNSQITHKRSHPQKHLHTTQPLHIHTHNSKYTPTYKTNIPLHKHSHHRATITSLH